MNGLKISEDFYFEVVKPLIVKDFPQLEGKFAAGLIGYGSDVLGNDDELSRDHEWGPRGHLWLQPEDYIKYARVIDELLNQKLPLTYKGHSTRYRWSDDFGALIGTNQREGSIHHIAITTIERHMKLQFGIPKREGEYYLSDIEWLCLPEQKLIELTRGRVFEDPTGEITTIRKEFGYYNDQVWMYKLLYCWQEMSNIQIIPLCFVRGDDIGAKLCLNKVLENIMRLTYLYNRVYYPGYMKWFGYEFDKLPYVVSDIKESIRICQKAQEKELIIEELEKVLTCLVEVHNQIGFTKSVRLEKSKVGRGLWHISVDHICDVIEENLNEELRTLHLRGGCDQWITNGDVLLWAEHFTKMKELFEQARMLPREGVGDLIV